MTTNFHRIAAHASRSATDLHFPGPGPLCAGNAEAFEPAATAHIQAGGKIASGSGWYHDAAIQAEQRRRT